MQILKKILLALGILFFLFVIFGMWYVTSYSMDLVKEYEFNDKELPYRVLIATQGSAYKNAVEEEIVEYLKSFPVYGKVMDIRHLPDQEVDEWDAIIIMHTWEYSQPPLGVKTFMDKNDTPTKVFVITTSTSGEEYLHGVDAIARASIKEQAPEDATRVIEWLEDILIPEIRESSVEQKEP